MLPKLTPISLGSELASWLNTWLMDRYLKNITIPAAFIKKKDGDVLKSILETSQVYVVMDWNDVLPRARTVCGSSVRMSVCSCRREGCRSSVRMFLLLDKPGRYHLRGTGRAEQWTGSASKMWRRDISCLRRAVQWTGKLGVLDQQQ